MILFFLASNTPYTFCRRPSLFVLPDTSGKYMGTIDKKTKVYKAAFFCLWFPYSKQQRCCFEYGNHRQKKELPSLI